MRTIDIHHARAHLAELVEQAARGESFLIAVAGRPRVRVLPLDARERAQAPHRLGPCRLAAHALGPQGEAQNERRAE